MMMMMTQLLEGGHEVNKSSQQPSCHTRASAYNTCSSAASWPTTTHELNNEDGAPQGLRSRRPGGTSLGAPEGLRCPGGTS
eukprot:4820278-Karenia_brevis.AAC.1